MKKRVLSLILALVLCVGLLPMAASADEPTEYDRARIARLPENPGKPVLIDPEAAGFLYGSWDYPVSKEDVFAQLEELTHQLISGKSTETEQAKAIFDWVAQNITYDYETAASGNTVRGAQNGIKTFYRRTGVCDGYALLVQLMYIIAGLPTIYAVGTAHGTPSTNHAWNAVYADGRWIFLDATWKIWDIDPLYHNDIVVFDLTAELVCNIRPERLAVKNTKGYEIPKVLVYPSYVDWVDGAVENCPELETIIVPKNIKLIGCPAYKCENLRNIIFEDGNDCEITGSFMFLPITSVKLPEGVTESGWCFSGCKTLTDVVIPSTVKKINSFDGCASLRSITLPDGVEEISDSAFRRCTSLTEINIPYGVKEIQNATFYSCSSLKNITLPSSVTKIAVSAFGLCESLESIYIPSSVTEISPYGVFGGCPNVVIYTEPGSYAETYAKQNNIKVETSGAPTPTPTPADSGTPSAWAQPEVSEATQAGLVPSGLLSSYTSAITREEFCRLMVKLIEAESGKDIASYASSQGKEISAPFADTSSQEVKAAYALGIVNGVSATSFNPSGSITRQEAAAMLTRTAKLLGLSSGESVSFADSGSIASWAADSVSFVSGLTDPTTGGRVMGGTGSGFSPLGTYTREQAIATALRLFHCAA